MKQNNKLNELKQKIKILIKQNERLHQNNQIIIQQNLFILDYLIGDDKKREQIKEYLNKTEEREL